MLIILEEERPISWNKIYAGMHWTARKTLVDTVHLLVRAAISNQIGTDITPYESRVRITIRAFFNKYPLDPCNIPAKIYIDGLLGVIIKDDSIKYVAGVTTESHKDKDRPRVEIEITEEA